jgi:hypothetical protein
MGAMEISYYSSSVIAGFIAVTSTTSQTSRLVHKLGILSSTTLAQSRNVEVDVQF